MSESGETYDWLTLDGDEEILWAGQPATETLYGAVLVGIPLLPLLGLGLLVIASAYLTRENTDYVITDKSVYKKTGIFSRSVSEVEYEKVQNTSFSVGVVGRYFGYGNVDISTAGGSGVEMSLRGVTEPQDVQKRLSRRVKEVQGGRGRGDEEAKPDVLGEILSELRAIRVALEGDGSAGAERHDGATDTTRRDGTTDAPQSDTGGATDWDPEQP
ncbi:PH domain-containing protein [Haloarcula onubensis]|uniref:PH domain-containing protein n=1 Tax=Haloarcula onubensis TaxID=2950539 RepID=A0ABU2FKN2_9EURY|nr:PH domain-containing protein [Halomicroarcula sp. S3CR25-11]MDS0281288.1 PH domain-containing protein [Halomicroarcula sp. S3CR25-11]